MYPFDPAPPSLFTVWLRRVRADPVGALACDDMCSCALEGRVSVFGGLFLTVACSFVALRGTLRCHWSCPLLVFACLGYPWMRPRCVFAWADRQAPAPASLTRISKIANALKKFDYAGWKCPFCVDLASQKNSFVFIILHKWATAFSAFDFGRSVAVFYIFGAAGAEITSSVTTG